MSSSDKDSSATVPEVPFFDTRGRPIVPKKAKEFMSWVNSGGSADFDEEYRSRSTLARTLSEEWSLVLHNLCSPAAGPAECSSEGAQAGYDPKAQTAPEQIVRHKVVACGQYDDTAMDSVPLLQTTVIDTAEGFLSLLEMELRHRGWGGLLVVTAQEECEAPNRTLKVSIKIDAEHVNENSASSSAVTAVICVEYCSKEYSSEGTKEEWKRDIIVKAQPLPPLQPVVRRKVSAPVLVESSGTAESSTTAGGESPSTEPEKKEAPLSKLLGKITGFFSGASPQSKSQ